MKSRLPELAGAALLVLCLPALAQTPVAAAGPTAPATAPAAHAADAKNQLTTLPSAADLRPTGPVQVSANRAEVTQGNTAVYLGNVVFDSNTLKLDGDRLEVKRAADGQFEAKMVGAPAHMAHAGAGPDNPTVTAHAKTLTYDSRTGNIDLAGDVLVTRGKDEIHGDTVRYNVLDRSMDANGGTKGRVNIIIQPPPPAPGSSQAPGSAAPAPAVAPPAAPAPGADAAKPPVGPKQ